MFSLEDITNEDLSFKESQPQSILSVPEVLGSIENIPQQPVEEPVREEIQPDPAQRVSLEEIVSEVEEPVAQGRSKTERDIATEYLKSNIESGEFFTWSDYDEKVPLEEYLNKMSSKDIMELLDKNIEKKKNIGYEQAPVQLRNALPPKMQYALDYIAQGGDDLETLFSQLAKATRTEKLDVTNEEHVPEIVRSYLYASGMVPANLVEEQIQEWKEGGLLEKKSPGIQTPAG